MGEHGCKMKYSLEWRVLLECGVKASPVTQVDDMAIQVIVMALRRNYVDVDYESASFKKKADEEISEETGTARHKKLSTIYLFIDSVKLIQLLLLSTISVKA